MEIVMEVEAHFCQTLTIPRQNRNYLLIICSNLLVLVNGTLRI